MHFRTFSIAATILSTLLSSAWSLDLSGKVTNQAGKPVGKAVVTLANKNLKDTTDEAGTFKVSDGTFTINRNTSIPTFGKISIEKGRIMFGTTRTSPVRVDVFDMRGKLINTIMDRTITAGNYQLDIPAHLASVSMQIMRISTGEQRASFRYVPLGHGTTVMNSSASAGSGQDGFASVKAIIDTIRVTASGYMSSSTPISSYTEPVTIKLDTMPLAKFSFFVTSLAGLQALSGSENGFGGDFTFGKTGQGAGLLGADSICECLAERSMPGSKIKKWRAFLSASKGPDGKQVNAIDRIGSGPWYDRLGRLLGNNLTELTTGDRPANADAAIKNDLPNEDGVPNHRPDPNKAQVDNHMFVTGSDKTGKLYTQVSSGSSNATCDDWTSKTSTTSKPRCGLSWPQAMGGGMKNWISQMNGAGCLPGLDLTDESRSGTPGVYTIGNGGGYGGFYCFALNP
jgi:hypothetical protein